MSSDLLELVTQNIEQPLIQLLHVTTMLCYVKYVNEKAPLMGGVSGIMHCICH